MLRSVPRAMDVLCSNGLSFTYTDYKQCTWDFSGYPASDLSANDAQTSGEDYDGDGAVDNDSGDGEAAGGGSSTVVTYRDSWTQTDFPYEDDDPLDVSVLTEAWPPSTHESYIPFMPNVLKVFLENGQTKSFKYDNKTTVKDVLNALQEKLSITCVEHFALVLLNMKSTCQKTYSLLQETDSLAEIAARPGSQHFKCLFRVAFVPKDAYDLLRKDNTAFEYYFTQCCNDVIQGRFASDLKYDVALRLAALHIQQHALSGPNNQSKVSVKAIEKECGLERFVPQSLMDTMKGKDLRKMLTHYVKANQSLAAPGQKQLTPLQAKLHYLKVVSQLRSFGTKCFMATLVEKKTEAMLVVGPKCGIAVVINIKNNTMFPQSGKSSRLHSGPYSPYY